MNTNHRHPSRLLALVALAGVGALALSSATTAAGTPASSASDDAAPYRLGVSLDASGPARGAASPQLEGLRAAVEGINARGGVDGHPIDLVIRDDASVPATAVAVLNDLVREDVSATVGWVGSVAAAAVIDPADRAGIAVMTTSAPSELVQEARPSVFATVATLNAQGRAGLDFIKARVDAGELPENPTISVFHYSSPAGQAWMADVEDYAGELGLSFTEVTTGDVGAANLSSQAIRIAGSDPDAVLLFVGPDALTLANALDAAGLDRDTYLVNYSFGASPAVLGGYEGLGFTNYVAVANWRLQTEDNAGIAEFLADVEAIGGDPTQSGVQDGYAYGLIAAAILADCGHPCDRAAFLAAANQASIELDVAFGPIEYTETDREGITAVRFVTMTDGEIAYVGDPVPIG